MSDRTINGAMEYRPPFAMRVWLALGFRYSAYLSPPDDDEAIYATHHVITHWDWRDRLRILVSGVSEAVIRVETDAPQKLKRTVSSAAVLAPRRSDAHDRS